MKKNIGLLIPSINEGGAERVVSRLSHILFDNYNVFVIVFEDTYMKYPISGELINIGIKANPGINIKKVTLPIRRALKLRKIKKLSNLDVVISFMDSPNLVNILSLNKNCKTIISIRNYEHNNLGKTIKKVISKFYNKADYIVAVSKVIEKNLIETYKVNSNKIRTIYNPYNISQIDELKNQELKPEYKNFFEEGFFFISVGRNMFQKGFWHLIKSFKLVHNKYPEVKLIIIGRDESEGKAEKLVRDLKIENSVLFTGSQENPFNFIKNSDVYVLTSLFEGFPNGMVEAMACGCPIIATDCKSGPNEILNYMPDLSSSCRKIERADFGLLVPAFDMSENWDSESINDNEEEMAKAMVLYKENSELREHYKAKSLERAKNFNYETCKTDFIKVIEQL